MSEPPNSRALHDWIAYLAQRPDPDEYADRVGAILHRAEYLENLGGFLGGRTADALSWAAADLRRYAAAIESGILEP